MYYFFDYTKTMFNPEELFSPDQMCEFCTVNLSVSKNQSECPMNFIDPSNYYAILEEQFVDETTPVEEASYIVGQQIFLAIDAVLSQQKKWAQKSLMGKFEEVLNRYTELTSFVVALRDTDVLQDIEDVIGFLLNPSEYDDLFAIWIEFGQPQKDDDSEDTWQDFVSAVSSCGWKIQNS